MAGALGKARGRAATFVKVFSHLSHFVSFALVLPHSSSYIPPHEERIPRLPAKELRGFTMVDFIPNTGTFGYAGTGARAQADIDQGLRTYMLGIYNYMSIGLAITGLAALGIFMMSVTGDPSLAAAKLRGGIMLTEFGKFLFVSPFKWVVMLSPLAVVLLLTFGQARLSAQGTLVTFFVYAALVGVSLSTILMVYTHTSVARVFFITAASFAALSLYGYTTKRDLSAIGTFLFMGLIGLMIASVVNIFLQSSALQFIMSIAGVGIFAGLTAWDTQKLKADYVHGYAYESDGSVVQKASVFGALTLYLDFINMFQFLLQLLGDRNND